VARDRRGEPRSAINSCAGSPNPSIVDGMTVEKAPRHQPVSASPSATFVSGVARA